MASHQAILYTCSEVKIVEALHDFIENDLSLYAVEIIAKSDGMKRLLEEGEARNEIFVTFEKSFTEHSTPRVIILSHNGCSDLGTVSFESIEEENRERELKLRHVISIVQSKYPDKQIDAYLALFNGDDKVTFKKVS